MRGEIKDLHHRLGTTSIYVTHDQVEAMTMGDRIVVMNQGIVEQIGAPLEVFDQPRNTFVAGFVGSPAMNFIDGELEADQGGPAVHTANDLMIPIEAAAAKHRGRRVILGVRPHHLQVDPQGALRAEVRDVQPTGVETILLCRLAGKDVLVQTTERIRIPPGQEIRLSLEKTKIHLFDATNGERLAA